MTEWTIGQDVLVETDCVLDGQAFIASVDEETENLVGDGVVVNARHRDGLPGLVQVSESEALPLTEVFEALR